MRVVSGKAKGTVLKTIKEESTRPTKDMVKEALFSILHDRVQDCSFLDLFAGSGGIGIEALSRGSKLTYFVDSNPDCINVIKDNLLKTKLIDNAILINMEYKGAVEKLKDKSIDIVYIDPPYNKGLGREAIELITKYNVLDDNGIIILESDTDEKIEDTIGVYERYNCKKYGRNILNFFVRKE